MDREAGLRVVGEMLEGIELSPDQIAALAARARDGAYWSGLAPDLPLSSRAPSGLAGDEPAARKAADALGRDGYFSSGPVLGPGALAAINRAVDAVRGAGWPPVFALVYDCLWAAVRDPFIARVAASRLGPGFRQIPHLWVHLVPALAGARGWMPHFDGLRARRLTIWIALTDATVANGCIHLVPPDALPASFRTTDFDTAVVLRDVMAAMHATRALEAKAGAMLGWDFDVFHWGGRAAGGAPERRSISLEFIAGDEPPKADELPLLDVAGPLPPLAVRLDLIARALDNYAAREAALRRFRALAPHLTA
jgi:hypothetical protein